MIEATLDYVKSQIEDADLFAVNSVKVSALDPGTLLSQLTPPVCAISARSWTADEDNPLLVRVEVGVTAYDYTRTDVYGEDSQMRVAKLMDSVAEQLARKGTNDIARGGAVRNAGAIQVRDLYIAFSDLTFYVWTENVDGA